MPNVTIDATNGADAITIIARDSITGTDGIKDFTVTVNATPQIVYPGILFINADTLTINALAGSDQIVIRTPAPNQAEWDVDVTINGGVPSTDGDQLILETPGQDSVVYTPGTTPTAAAS